MTHEMSKEVQEFNEVSQHLRLHCTALLSLQSHVVPSETSGLVYVLKRVVRCRRL